MMWLYIALLFIVYIAGSATNSISSHAGPMAGLPPATFLYLGTGALCVFAWGALFVSPLDFTMMMHAPWYTYVNAVGNIAVVRAIMYLIPKIGVGAFFTSVTTGQFVMALLADHFGLSGNSTATLSMARVGSAIMVVAGAIVFTFISGGKGTVTQRCPQLLALGVSVGVAQTVMDAVNSRTGAEIGVTNAVFLYLCTGAVAVLVWSLVTSRQGLVRLAKLPPLYYLPGALNVFMVWLLVLVIPTVGVGVYTGVRFLSSTLASILFDSLGLLGMPRISINKGRAIGSVMMLVGVCSLVL